MSREKEPLFPLWKLDWKVEHVSTLGQQMRSCFNVRERWRDSTTARPGQTWRMAVLWCGWNLKCSCCSYAFLTFSAFHFFCFSLYSWEDQPVCLAGELVCKRQTNPLKEQTCYRQPVVHIQITLPHRTAVNLRLDIHCNTANTCLLWTQSSRWKTEREEKKKVLM